eukprot:2150145-Amphidinium_carterae.2
MALQKGLWQSWVAYNSVFRCPSSPCSLHKLHCTPSCQSQDGKQKLTILPWNDFWINLVSVVCLAYGDGWGSCCGRRLEQVVRVRSM